MKADLINKTCQQRYNFTIEDYEKWCIENKKSKYYTSSKKQFVKLQIAKVNNVTKD